MENAARRLAVIGLGNIGGGVAENLLAAGHEVVVADLDPAKVAHLEARGAAIAESAGTAVRGVDVAFTSVPGPRQIDEVGSVIAPAMTPGSIWVDLSTSDLATTRAQADRCHAHHVAFVDAPVSGGPEGAAAGTLSIFVGGDADTVDRVRPILGAIGSQIDHLGPVGAGVVAKIAQVTLCYTQTVTLIEAMLLGVKGGVEPSKMLDVITNSAGTSYSAETYGPEILAGTYDASFPLSHAAKDMRLAIELAAAVGADLPFTAGVDALYAEALAVFGPDAAHCLAAQLIERRNDLILHEQEQGHD